MVAGGACGTCSALNVSGGLDAFDEAKAWVVFFFIEER